MKTLGILTAGLISISIAAMADTITSPGSLVGIPANFQSTTGANAGQGPPFWNNNSVDGANMNAGDFLTGSNPVMGSTNYLGSGASYLSTGGPGPDSPSFTFKQSGGGVQATLLYSEAPSNYTYGYTGFAGTQIGLYNVADPSQNETLFASGTLYNLSAVGGVINNNVSPQPTVSFGSWSNYGVYAYTCWFNDDMSTYCNMFYSDASLNQTGKDHQHFAVFENPTTPNTFYVGFDDGVYSSVEGNGDFNDVIFKLQTTQLQTLKVTEDIPTTPAVTPEPATWTVMGLGLAGLGLLRRRAKA